MARKVAQIRYYKDNGDLNYPKSASISELRSGKIFANYMPALQIGIQTMPGIKFYLNDATEPIIIGNTGIYELNVDNFAQITSLSFDVASLNIINDSSTAYIVVDILYEEN